MPASAASILSVAIGKNALEFIPCNPLGIVILIDELTDFEGNIFRDVMNERDNLNKAVL